MNSVSRSFVSALLLITLIHPVFSSEVYDPRNRSKRSVSSAALDPTRVTQLLGSPRVFIYEGFLSSEECAHLIELAEGKLERATVVDGTGKVHLSEARTSSGVFLKRAQDEVVAHIEARIAAWTFLPEENGEPIQVLRYEHGQEFKPHWDFFRDKTSLEFGGHRVATVVMYLSNVEKGGETVFFGSEVNLSRLAYDYSTYNYSAHCSGRLSYAVKPKKGDALLFFSLHPNATIDISSMHAGCPVIDGEKWSATKWIHVRPFFSQRRYPQDGECTDLRVNCPRWAQDGECQKNQLFMVGSEQYQGSCRKSCGVCSSTTDTQLSERSITVRGDIELFLRRNNNTTNGFIV